MEQMDTESIILQDRDDAYHFLLRPVERLTVDEYFDVVRRLNFVAGGDFWEVDPVARSARKLDTPQ